MSMVETLFLIEGLKKNFFFRSLGALGRALGPVVASMLYWLAGPEFCYSIGGLALTIPYFMLKRCN